MTNQNATRGNIIAYLKSLVVNSVQGDSIVFYYSGHGTHVTNIDSDFELDGLDEAICPHDYASAGVIRDDDFKNILSSLKAGVNLEVIFDYCHSGTITRSLDLTVNEELEVKNNFWPRSAKSIQFTCLSLAMCRTSRKCFRCSQWNYDRCKTLFDLYSFNRLAGK